MKTWYGLVYRVLKTAAPVTAAEAVLTTTSILTWKGKYSARKAGILGRN